MLFLRKLSLKYLISSKFLTDRERVRLQQQNDSRLNSGGKPMTDKERVNRPMSKEEVRRVLDPDFKGSDGTPRSYSKDKSGLIHIKPKVALEILKKTDILSPEEKALLKEGWANEDALRRLLLSRPPGLRKELLQALQEGSESGYTGANIHNVGWRDKTLDHPSKELIPSRIKDFRGVLGKDVPVGGHDPFQWADMKYRISHNFMQKQYDKEVVINTRSDLIGHSDYLAVLNPNKHTVNMHFLVTPSYKDVRNQKIYHQLSALEPGTPSATRRMEAVKRLHQAGIKVNIVFDALESPKLPKEIQQLFQQQRNAIKKMAPAGVPVKLNKQPLNENQVQRILDIFNPPKDDEDEWEHG